MTHASQLSPLSSDYFSHKPRSFLSKHTDFDEKLAASPNPNNLPYTPDRGRRQTRLVAYDQPVLQVVPGVRPRAPLRRTLIRLFALCTIIVLATLGWRCESVGCKGRGGGALVGDYIGGGSVVAGWGTPEGMDLSKIWDTPSWGGERQGGEQKDKGSSTLDALRDEEGELVGFKGTDEQGLVVWDDEEKMFGSGENAGVAEGAGGEGIVGEAVQVEGVAQQEQVLQIGDASEGGISAEAPQPAAIELVSSAMDETTGPVEGLVEAVAVEANAQQADNAAVQAIALQDSNAPQDSASLEQKGWIGSMGGLF